MRAVDPRRRALPVSSSLVFSHLLIRSLTSHVGVQPAQKISAILLKTIQKNFHYFCDPPHSPPFGAVRGTDNIKFGDLTGLGGWK